MAKANGADDIVDIVVPRAVDPRVHGARSRELAPSHQALVVGCGHAGDGNVHLVGVPARRRGARTRCMRELFAAGMALGGAISGEHGIGTEKKQYFLELEDPAKLDLMRRIKAAFDPARHPQPRHASSTRGGNPMNGAQALIRTLVDAGVDVCFTNPGTSEMHFVAALDAVPEMRGVLALFEGVATGAADGYGRMADQPAATLLHLGPGLGNGLANLHNARRAHTPIVNIVGDHATYHKQYDAPLESDIETRRPATCSGWIRTLDSAPTTSARDAADAVAAALRPARPGRHADPARRRLVVRRRRAGRAGHADRAARRRSTTPVAERRQGRCARASRPRCSSAARRCRERGLRRRQPGRRRHRRQAARARRSRPASSAAPACPPSTGSATSPSSRSMQLDGAAPPRPRRRQGAGVVLRLPRQGQRPRARGLRGARARRARRRRRRRARARSPTPSARRRGAAAPGRRSRPERADRRARPPRRVPTSSARCCPRARSSPTRPTRPGLFVAGATAGAPPPRLAHASPAAPSARACRSRSAPRSRARTGR